MLAAPEPNMAMMTGAETWRRRLPNGPRTAGVATTMFEPSGSFDDGPRVSRFAGGKPRAWIAAHITGSQATMAALLTWAAIQLAACCRLAATAATTPELPLPEPVRPAARLR